MDFNAELLSKIITGFVVFWMVTGFLWGVIRGFKRSFLRLLVLGITAAVCFFVLPKVLVSISGSSVGMEANKFIDDALSGLLSSLNITASAISATIEIIKIFALLACSSLIFLALFIIVKLLTWPIYAIFAVIFVRKNDPNNTNKHRFLGGLVGVFQGLLIAFVFLLPVAGFSNIAHSVTDAYSNITAEETTDNDIIGKIAEYSSAYKNSIAGKIFGVSSLDQKAFDYLSTAKLKDGTKISVSVELSNMLTVADSISSDFNENDIFTRLVKDGDFDTEEFITYLTDNNGEVARDLFDTVTTPIFGSTIMRTFLIDSVNAYIDSFDKSGAAEKLKLSDINWNEEKTTFNNVMADLLVNVGDLIINDIPDDLTELPLKEIGKSLDDFKSLQLVKPIFNNLIEELFEKADLFDMIKEQTTYEINGTKVEGIDLRPLINEFMNDQFFERTLQSVADTLALINSLTAEDSEGLDLNNVVDLIDVIRNLPDELVDVVDDLVKGMIDDQFGDQVNMTDIIPDWEELNIKEIIESESDGIDYLMNMYEVSNDPDAEIELDAEELVDVLGNSPLILDLLDKVSTENSTDSNGATFKPEDIGLDRTELQDAIDNNETIDDATKEKLMNIFFGKTTP